MSKATNNTQRVTFGNSRRWAGSFGIISFTPVLVDGEEVASIRKDEHGDYALIIPGMARQHFESPIVGERQVTNWRAGRDAAKAAAIAHFTPTEEPAQVETVEVEEAAQAETVEAEEAAQVETVEDHVVVTNDEGRAFSVVVVMQGDRYGLNDCLTHGSPDPLVEFYDAKHSGSVHGPLGQFVSRYYLSTLAGEDQWGLEPGQGLNLHGGVREWSVSWQNVCEAVAYARRRQAAA